VETTRLSSKGEIVLPRHVRISRALGPGTKFTIEEAGDGIRLPPAALFAGTSPDEVAGCLRSTRKAKTPAQMRAAIRREVVRRRDRGRY